MFVIKVGTVSAMLFTVGVMLLGKTVAGNHIRQAVAYDHVEHPHDPKNEQQDWTKDTIRSLQTAVTSCDAGEGKIAFNWNGGTCYQSFLSDCCGPLIDFTTCNAYERWPGKWSNGVCSGVVQSDCCVVETGYTIFTFETCDAPDKELPDQWDTDGTCTALYLSDCCRPVLKFTTCDVGYFPFSLNWKDGVCSAYDESDCCVTFVTSCDEPEEGPIRDNFQWDDDNIFLYCFPDESECCGPLLNFTTPCSGDEPLNWPSAWIDGVCSAADKWYCCYSEDNTTRWSFGSCYDSQEPIPGVWVDDVCKAYSLSDCCRSVSGTTSTGNGGSTPKGIDGNTSDSEESSSAGLIAGIVVALLIVAVLVTLISCARCRNCPWYSKMHCFSKNQPLPATITVASSNAPTKEVVVDTDDRSVTEVPPETAAPESNGPSEAPSKMERLSGLWTTAKKAYQRAADVADTVEKYTASINNVAQIVETVQDEEEEVVVAPEEEVVMQEEEEAVQEEEEAIHEEEAVPEEDEVLEGQV
jgi:hypothetical protein